MRQSIKKYVRGGALVALSSTFLMAGGDVSPPIAEEAVIYTAVDNSDAWKFQLSPMFLWAVKIDGQSTVGPVDSPLELDFGDVVENLNVVFTFHFEANKGDWALFSELQYVNLDPAEDISPTASMEIDFKNYLFELGTAYTFSRSEHSTWEGLVGLRYNQQKLKTTLQPASMELINVTENWTDVFVGLRNSYAISDKWLLISRADIGAGGADLVWNAVVMADYRFNDWGSVFFGYKAMDYDYNNDEIGLDAYAYDATQHGPLLGLNIHW